MRRTAILGVLVMVLVGVWTLLGVLGAGPAAAAPVRLVQEVAYADQRDAVARAAAWLVATHQNEDGGYSGFSQGAGQAPSDVAGTTDAILALSSAGFDPAAPAPGHDNTPVGYLQQQAADAAAYAAIDGSTAGKLVLALAAANQNPRDFEGEDFVLALTNHLSPTGQYGVNNAFNQSLALLGLSAANEPAAPEAVDWLLAQQATGEGLDGSWDDGFGTAGNVDATAMAVMALVASGEPADGEALARAADFLARTQLESGGWPYAPDLAESANSTALAVQALRALGLDFYSAESPFAQNGVTPLQALLAWQSPAGAFQADFGSGRFDDFFATVQAIPAAAGRAFPLRGRYQAAQQAVACLATLQDPATGGWEQFATFGVNAAGTARAIEAIVAAGGDPAADMWMVNGTNAVQALENLTPEYLATGRGGGVGIVMQGVAAAGGDVTDFAGFNLPLQMSEYLSPTGAYDDTSFGPFAHAEAMLGLLVAGEEVDEAAVDFLLGAQDGGDWGSPDANGIALNVLGRLAQRVPETLDVLRATQLADGGWGFEEASNPNATSEVVQGLVSVGENPFAPAWSQVLSGTVVNAADAVLAQQGENGCWPNLFGPGDDPLATTDAIILLAQRPPWPEMAAAEAEPAEATVEATASPAPTVTVTATAEGAAEPTVVVEPTAEPTEAIAAAVETPVAEPTAPPPATAGPAGGNALNWVLVALAVLLVAGGAFWFVRRRT